MIAQRNQNRGQSCDLHLDQTVSTVPNSVHKTTALSTLSRLPWGHQVTPRLAVGRAGEEAGRLQEDQAGVPAWPPRLATEHGGKGRGAGQCHPKGIWRPESQQQREGRGGPEFKACECQGSNKRDQSERALSVPPQQVLEIRRRSCSRPSQRSRGPRLSHGCKTAVSTLHSHASHPGSALSSPSFHAPEDYSTKGNCPGSRSLVEARPECRQLAARGSHPQHPCVPPGPGRGGPYN